MKKISIILIAGLVSFSLFASGNKEDREKKRAAMTECTTSLGIEKPSRKNRPSEENRSLRD